MSRALRKELAGELLGTFILVFIGCGAVGAAVILGWLSALYQVAAVWTLGVTVAIMASKHWCPAHLNPAVTLAMCLARKHSWRRLLPYSLAQLTGAVLAAMALLMLFEPSILELEAQMAPGKGLPLHIRHTAQMFGEFFPNPGYADRISISWPMAMLAEGLATCCLLLAIFWITRDLDRMRWAPALLIGLTVGILIFIEAPYTQCGMNPARDLGPRLVAFLGEWGSNALNSPLHSNLTVYVLGPLLGAGAAGIIWRWVG